MNFTFNLAEYYSAISIGVDLLVDPLGILRLVGPTNLNLVSDVNSLLRTSTDLHVHVYSILWA